VPPGHAMRVKRGNVEIFRYWDRAITESCGSGAGMKEAAYPSA
jgi:hypothetical protein